MTAKPITHHHPCKANITSYALAESTEQSGYFGMYF